MLWKYTGSLLFFLKFQVKVLFVRNLANTVTEEILEKAFSQFGKLERVKKLKDYAFIHFDERDGAVKAMEEMNGKDLEGENIEIVFAKPPDQKRKVTDSC